MKKDNSTYENGVKFNNEQGQILLKIARNTIAEKLGYAKDEIEIPDEEIFRSGRGTFVTLKINEQLRGCIGNLESGSAVIEGIANNANHAAFNDHRFSPLSKEDFHKIDIEISILTEPVPLQYKNADELISKLRPGIDGVIIKKGNAGATFLPQVWKQLPEPVIFLEHLCQKAGLDQNTWRLKELEVLIYQVQYFEE